MNNQIRHLLRSLLGNLFPALLMAIGLGLSGFTAAQSDGGAEAKIGGRVLRVGPERELRSLAAASMQARNGDTIEVDAGEYRADVAVWTQEQLTIRAVGGRARMVAAGANAEGKAIWVMRSGSMLVENIDFSGARVRDRNGAGIRFEKGRLTVRNCTFLDNENGILTSNEPSAELVVENSEFGNNGAGDGQSHNLYVGGIAKLTVQASYFHHAKIGHLLKTRAAENHILYNRLTDENGGTASYELEFPAGGVAIVVGNLIQQSARSENSTIISYGAEGYKWPQNRLVLAYNTIINERTAGVKFLYVRPGERQVGAVNNVLAGGNAPAGGTLLQLTEPDVDRNTVRAERSDFVNAAAFDYRPAKNARWLAMPGQYGGGNALWPRREYVHPRGSRALPAGLTIQAGAFHSLD